jgi:hypothetical protein
MNRYILGGGVLLCLLKSQLVLADDENQEAKQFLKFDIPKGLNLSLSEEDSKATVGINFLKARNIYGLSLTGKLKNNTGEFVGLDGIDADTKINGSWSHIFVKAPPISPPSTVTFDEKSQGLAKFALRECKLLNALIEGERDSPVDNCENEQQLVAKLETLTFNRNDALSVSRSAHNINKKCNGYLDRPWARKYELVEMCKSTASLLSALRSGTTKVTPVITDFGVFTASASYFQSKFTWLDVDNITTDDKTNDKTKDGFDITLNYARIYGISLFKWEVGATFQKGYENSSSNTERELCFDFDTESKITECRKGFLLPPVEKETISPFIKLTKQFSEDNLIKSIGLDIKYTFDDAEQQDGSVTELDRWTIETPIHLVTFMDKKISAGVKLGWVSEVKSKEDSFKVLLFISAPLSVF